MSSGFKQSDQDNVHKWLDGDKDNSVYAFLVDDAIMRTQVQVPVDDNNKDYNGIVSGSYQSTIIEKHCFVTS